MNEKKPVEEWAKAKGHAGTWRFLAAKAHENWPVGLEVTETEYDAAVAAAIGVTLR